MRTCHMHLFKEPALANTDNNNNNNNNAEMTTTQIDIRMTSALADNMKTPRIRFRNRKLSLSLQHDKHPKNQTSVTCSRCGTGETGTTSNHDATLKACRLSPVEIESTLPPDSECVRFPARHRRLSLKSRFHVMKTLGEGSYGKVKLAVDNTSGDYVAIKYIKKIKIQEKKDKERVRREIKILSSLQHKHIVNVRDVFEKRDKIVLVLDYAQGGELYDYLEKADALTETEARRIFRQIVSAIHYCHQNGVVHRDLKLENIILDKDKNVKIADFGLSNYFHQNETLNTFCGSLLYASPEIINGKPYHGPEVDVWSLGVILYILVYGAMPFEASSLSSLKQQISSGDYLQPEQPSDSAGLIRHMLTATAPRRANMEDVLRHWWVNFGHSHMPNGEPYSPDQGSPTTPHPNRRSSCPTSQRTTHHRNQDNISPSVDSNLRACQISTKFVSNGNTNTFDSSAQDEGLLVDILSDNHNRIYRKHCPNASKSRSECDILELPHILNNELPSTVTNSAKEPALYINDKKEDKENEYQIIAVESKEKDTTGDELSAPVFDSSKMPTRGILKRKGKFSGGDSGCIMNDDLSTKADDSSITARGDDNDYVIRISRADNTPCRLSEGLLSTHDDNDHVFVEERSACHTICSTQQNRCCFPCHQELYPSFPFNSLPTQKHSSLSALFTSPQICKRAREHYSEIIDATRSTLAAGSITNILQERDAQLTKPENSSTATKSTLTDRISSHLNHVPSLTNPFLVQVSINGQLNPSSAPQSILSKKPSVSESDKKRPSISSIESNSSINDLDLSHDSAVVVL